MSCNFHDLIECPDSLNSLAECQQQMFSLYTHQHELNHFIAHLHSLKLCLIKKFCFVLLCAPIEFVGKLFVAP